MYHHRRVQNHGMSEYKRYAMTSNETIPKEPEKPPVPKEPEKPPIPKEPEKPPVPKEPERPLDPPIPPPPMNPDGDPGLDPLPGRSDPKLPNWRAKG